MERSSVTRRGPSLASLHFLRRPCPSSLIYSLRARPFVSSLAFLCRDCPAQFSTDWPFPSALAASRSGRGAWELTEGRGEEGEASPSTWAEGRVRIRVAARVNEGSRPGTWRKEMGSRPSHSERPRRRYTFRGLRSVPVKYAESFTSQLLQCAQRRRGTLVRLWKLRRRGSSGNHVRA